MADSIAEAAETRVWLDFSFDCQYLDSEIKDSLKDQYSKIIGKVIVMINQVDLWKL